MDEPTAALMAALEDYPPFELPNRGPRLARSQEELAANLAHFRSVRSTRIELLRQVTEAGGVAWPDQLDGADGRELIVSLHAWAGTTWPHLTPQDPKRFRYAVMDGASSGEYIAGSLVADVSLTLGELIHQLRPSLDWGIDDDPVNRSDGMASCNRVVLVGRWLPRPTQMVVIDLEVVVLQKLLHPEWPSEQFENGWLRLYEDSVSGAHEGAHLLG